MKKDKVKNNLLKGLYNEKICELYSDADSLDAYVKRYVDAIDRFAELFEEDDIFVFSAPGRIELIGNHTDHQHGQVIAASINKDIIAVASKRNDTLVRIVSDQSDMIVADVNEIEMNPDEDKTTKALIKGVLKGIEDTGFKVGGFDAYLTSDVPVGSGLSSSAAFETIIGNIVSAFYNKNTIPPEKIAVIGQFAENVFYGKPCGLMDQMACSIGSLVYIDFSNPAEPKTEKLELDLNALGYSLCVTDTGESHEALTAEYAAIPYEMKSVAQALGENFLNDVKREDFEKSIPILHEKCSDRAILRAIHFYDENERVMKQVRAIKRGHLGKFLKLENESGISSFNYLQNVYTFNQNNQRGLALALAVGEKTLAGTGAIRVHGGGFAGTILAFVPDELTGKYKKTQDEIFGEGACSILKVRKYGGIQAI